MDINETVRQKTEAFCADIAILIRTDLYEKLAAKLRGPQTQPELTDAQVRTLEALRSVSDPVTSRELAIRLDRAESTVRAQLGALVAKAVAKRIEDGPSVRYVAA